MLVLGQPANGIGFEGPEGLQLLEREEPAVRDASTVPGIAIRDELLADVGVDAVSADEQIDGGRGAIFKGCYNFISGVLR
jgi:hypothetical protein